MKLENRKIPVGSKGEVSSVWAIPDTYRSDVEDAILLAHGAGNAMDHPFMSFFHTAFAEAGLLSVKFNFPYTEQGRKAPDAMPVLEATWRALIQAVREDHEFAPKRLYCGGKSMGGRVASRVVASGEACSGLIFLGYPLHPPKQPEKLRVEHWTTLQCPLLFLQGTRDSLCDLTTLKTRLPQLSGPVTLHVIDGGDHSFKLPKSMGKTESIVWREVAEIACDWLRARQRENR